MAVDYSKYRDEDGFYQNLANANTYTDQESGETCSFYPDGVTGYEDFYIDMLAFWRNLYNPKGKEIDQPTTGDDPEHSRELYTYSISTEITGTLDNLAVPIENIIITENLDNDIQS